MYTNTPGGPPNASVHMISRYRSMAILAIANGWIAAAFGQTPNWGGDSPQTRQDPAGATKSSPWGTTGTIGKSDAIATIPQQRRQGQLPGKPEPIPPGLVEILNRPDTDTVTLTNGHSKSVKELRAEVNTRQSIVQALKNGEAPAGRKRVRIAVARSPQHDELLNSSKLMRETARREAGGAPGVSGTSGANSESHVGQSDSTSTASAWGAPRTTTAANGQQDPAAAWATAGSTQGGRPGRRLGGAPGVPVAATELHTGIGTSSLPTTGAAFVQSKPGFTTVSQQPSQSAVAQSIPAGIAIVNGHSKGVQFTPGGLYTIIGSGFGSNVGAVDLIGPHLPGGRLGLPVTQWGDRQLQAQLPEPVSGVADQPVTLRVTTRTGTLFTMDVQFYATRQPITLRGVDLDLSQAFDMNLGAQNDWSATLTNAGNITREKSGNNINCPSIGKDTLRTRFPQGWALVEVAINSWLPTQGNPSKDFFGQDGDTVVSGSYNITQIPAGLTNQTFEVQWGVLRSHSTNGVSLIPSFHGNDFGWTGNDGCVSSYEVEVTMVGPAGLRPF